MEINAPVIPNQMEAMLEAFADGRIKALFLGGTNALSSFADSHALAEGLEKLTWSYATTYLVATRFVNTPMWYCPVPHGLNNSVAR